MIKCGVYYRVRRDRHGLAKGQRVVTNNNLKKKIEHTKGDGKGFMMSESSENKKLDNRS